jgi:hypothetical protein
LRRKQLSLVLAGKMKPEEATELAVVHVKGKRASFFLPKI